MNYISIKRGQFRRFDVYEGKVGACSGTRGHTRRLDVPFVGVLFGFRGENAVKDAAVLRRKAFAGQKNDKLTATSGEISTQKRVLSECFRRSWVNQSLSQVQGQDSWRSPIEDGDLM